jgi:mono/diheme cytochrome c family protein
LRTDHAFADTRRAAPGRAVVRAAVLAAVGVLALGAAGCKVRLNEFRIKMYDQAKYEPYEKSELFANQAAARPFPEGTVARGHLNANRPYYTGTLTSGDFVPRIPAPPVADEAGDADAWQPQPLTADFIARGRQRFDIFCSPCHGRLGEGNGMIVQRGYKQPMSYHQARLRNMPDGYFFDVITRGFGQMPSYASQVPVADRWAIVAYVRALQLSQNARLAELPADLRRVADGALAAADRPMADESSEPASPDHESTDGE